MEIETELSNDKMVPEEIEFRVIDKETGEIVGYEFYNSHFVNGFYYFNVNDIDKDDGSYICHTDSNSDNRLRPSHPLGGLIREQFLGVTDENGNKIYSRQPMHLLEESILVASDIIDNLNRKNKRKIFIIGLLIISIIVLLINDWSDVCTIHM